MSQLDEQYNRVINSLRSSYDASATPQERERLKYMLADVEAQYDAGREALTSLYADTARDIQQQIAESQAGTAQSVARAGEMFGGLAQSTRSLMEEEAARRIMENRGLGVGAARTDPTNEWVNLLESMTPIQQQYAQNIGDIGTSSLRNIAARAQLQGAASQGDLTRTAGVTRATAQMSAIQDVIDRARKEQERAEDREFLLQRDRLAAQEALRQIAAQSAARAQDADPFAFEDSEVNAARNGAGLVEPQVFAEQRQSKNLSISPTDWQYYYNAYTEEIFGRQNFLNNRINTNNGLIQNILDATSNEDARSASVAQELAILEESNRNLREQIEDLGSRLYNSRQYIISLGVELP